MESFQPSQSSKIGVIDILDEMHIEFDVVIHSFPSGWANILHCTPEDDYPRVIAFWIHANSASGQGFHSKYANDDNNNYGPNVGGSLILGKTYHLEMDITQSTFKIKINGVIVANDVVTTHQLFEDITCYASDPWHDAADVTISDLIIRGLLSTITESKSKL